MKSLNVFYENTLVGILYEDEEERLRFQYTESWLKNPASFPLSIALKLSNDTYSHLVSKSFFENLIPEGIVKERLDFRSGKNIKSEFNFLEFYGEDCAGAFVITQKNESQFQKYSTLKKEIKLKTIYEYLRNNQGLTDSIVYNEGGHFSLAGAQDKFPVLIEDDKFFIPMGNIPTTAIIKPAVRNFESTIDSPYNEFFCMRLARSVGLNVPIVDILDGEYPLYIVQRFDRLKKDGVIKRIHQQDFCQARGITSNKKYESDGGPTFADNFHLLKEHSTAPIPDLNQLLHWFWFNLSIGNNDCHSKNLAFVQTADGLRLSPFYDLLSTSIYKEISSKFTYSIAGQFYWYKLSNRHLQSQAKTMTINVATLKNSARELFNLLDENLVPQVKEFESRFKGVYTAKIIAKEIQKRVAFFRDKFL